MQLKSQCAHMCGKEEWEITVVSNCGVMSPQAKLLAVYIICIHRIISTLYTMGINPISIASMAPIHSKVDANDRYCV